MPEIWNAVIRSTALGELGRGPSFYLTVEWDDSTSQGFGGWGLSDDDGWCMIRLLLETLEVNRWEDLPGTCVRVFGDCTKLTRIGHITKNRWFVPETGEVKGFES